MTHTLFNHSGISLGRLRAFLDVMEAGSIAAATDRDPTRQSLYSRQIGELEREIGTPLFHRRGKRFLPTAVAKELASLTNAFAAGFDDIINRSQQVPSLIRIGAGESVYQWMLLPIAKNLEAALPGQSFEFHNLRSKEIHSLLAQGSLDIGIARSPAKLASAKLGSRPIGSLQLAVFYPAEQFPKPSLKALLSSKRLIGLSGEGSLWNATKQLMESLRIEPSLWMHFDSMPMVANALRKTPAVAILPLQADADLKDHGYRFLSSPQLSPFDREYGLFANERTLAMRPVIAKALDTLEELLDPKIDYNRQ